MSWSRALYPARNINMRSRYAIWITRYVYDMQAQRIGRGWPARACGAAFDLAREFTGTWCSMLVASFTKTFQGIIDKHMRYCCHSVAIETQNYLVTLADSLA